MPVLKAKDVAEVLRRGAPANVDEDVPARFTPGDRVVVRNLNPPGHTRAPRYIRCKHGTVERDHGVFIFPDVHALGQGEAPQHLYNVRFTGQAVWGPEAAPHDVIHLDLWDDYLDPA